MADHAASASFSTPESNAEAAVQASIPEQAPIANQSPIPEKYISDTGEVNTNAMAVRLHQLEKKLGEQSAAPAPAADPTPGTETTGNSLLTEEELMPYAYEAMSTGALSEASLKRLEDRGVSRELAHSVVAGKKAQLENHQNALAEAAGGREKFNQLANWANANLSAEEARAYNDQLQSGDRGIALNAVKSLQARAAQAAVGPTGQFLVGDSAPDVGVTPFRSVQEKNAAMRMPSKTVPGKFEYHTNPTYRAECDAKNKAMLRRMSQR
jgi:hypothetical protein